VIFFFFGTFFMWPGSFFYLAFASGFRLLGWSLLLWVGPGMMKIGGDGIGLAFDPF
jgi:hypothetical protein